MKKVYRFTGIIALLILLPAVLSVSSRYYRPRIGLADDRLTACPLTPNCICSEYTGQISSVEPLAFSGDPAIVWQKASGTIQAMGGLIEKKEDSYIHAVFTSRFYRFLDDLELRLDADDRLIHIRSASRAGYSDLGVNRKRVEQFRALMTTS